MSGHRRTTIPHPELVEYHLERETNFEIRQRLVLLHLIVKLDASFGLVAICDLVKVPESTAYVLCTGRVRQQGYVPVVDAQKHVGGDGETRVCVHEKMVYAEPLDHRDRFRQGSVRRAL